MLVFIGKNVIGIHRFILSGAITKADAVIFEGVVAGSMQCERLFCFCGGMNLRTTDWMVIRKVHWCRLKIDHI